MTWRILFSWIGHTDLRAMASSLTEGQRKSLLGDLGVQSPVEGPGPIKTLAEREGFDEIHLISNYKVVWNRAFKKWLGGGTQVHAVELDDPTDYGKIFQVADRVLHEQTSKAAKRTDRLCIHLSSGTPAMAAIWLLLGKSRYPATFYQTHTGRAWETDIPFDLALDFVPQLLREPDAHLQHLAAKLPSEVTGFEQIVGESKAIRLAVGRARQAAIRQVPILLLGESGTGKEMFARAIHAASSRSSGPFVPVNCAAMPKELLESELYGHKKGAFTGADRDRSGAFEEAGGGTLFLDEVGECDPAMQAKLLRVLQPPPGEGPCARVFRRLGESKERTSDVRIVAATNRDLQSAVAGHEFREDLYYRLAVITVNVPPLRQRKGDIPLIARALLDQVNTQFREEEPGFEDKNLSASTIHFVKQHGWPGNVRELYNVLLQAAVMSGTSVLERGDIKAAIAEMPRQTVDSNLLELPLDDGFNLEKHLESIHIHYLRRAMDDAAGVKSKAARLLGMKNYQTLDAQLKRLGVDWKATS